MVRAMAEHTPGPWEMYITPYGITIASGSAGWAVTTIPPSGPRDNPTHESNARLIAAAPDLLAALYEAREFIDGQIDVVDGSYGEPAPNRAMVLAQEIDAAIAKATGSLSNGESND